MSVRLLPLFPLPLVLFPRAPLPLHIFEPRYRQMLADCLAGDRLFGVIFRPEQVAEQDILPGTVGCVARIETADELPDGRSNIVVSGGDRFQLERFVPDAAPYHVAEVSLIGDRPESAAVLEPLSDRVRQLFDRVGRSARLIADDDRPVPALPDDAPGVAFAAASYIDLDPAIKQRLLASRSAAQRLRELVALLEQVAPAVEERAAVHTRAGGNGQGPAAEAG